MSDTISNETKAWWESRTIWGSLLTLISIVLSQFGIKVDDVTLQQIVDVAIQLGEIVGVIIAIWGRFLATQRLGFRRAR
jgi:uncharacterized membrane protein